MKIKEIRKKAFSKLKGHMVNSWVLALICALFIASFTLICILSELFVLLLIPFLILPFFFACAVYHAMLAEKDELSGGDLFGFYRLFFRTPFYNSFSAVKCFLKALLLERVIGFIATGVIYAIYAQSETFNITMNQLVEQLKDMSITYEQFQVYLEANDNELNNFMGLTNSVNFLAFAYAFIFFILREETTIYLRIKLANVPLAHQISRASIRANSKNFNKYYFCLNWPMLVIVLVGMVGGGVLSVFVFKNYQTIGAVGLCLGIALTATYLPFYFSNQETIADQMAVDIASFSEEYIQSVFEKYGVKVDKVAKGEKETVDGSKKDSDNTESK